MAEIDSKPPFNLTRVELNPSPFRYGSLIAEAIRQAPYSQLTQLGRADQEQVDQIIDTLGDRYETLDHWHRLNLEIAPTKPHEIFVDSIEKFRQLLNHVYTQLPNYIELDRVAIETSINEMIDHETSHVEIMRLLADRFDRVVYGVSMRRFTSHDGRELVTFVPSISVQAVISKIGLALAMAYPPDLSPADEATIRALGYDSKEEVFETADRLFSQLTEPIIWSR